MKPLTQIMVKVKKERKDPSKLARVKTKEKVKKKHLKKEREIKEVKAKVKGSQRGKANN